LGEVGVDRVELLDRGETGALVLDHQRAFAGQRGADDAADRRTDRRVVKIEFGPRHFGLAAADLGLGLTLRRDGLFVLCLGRRALARQRRDAACMLRGQIERSHCLVERRLACLQLDFERFGVDPVERIAGRHFGSLPEQALDDDTGDARTHFGNPRWRDPARQFADDGAGLRPDGESAHFRLGRCRRSGGHRLVTASQQRRHRSQHQNDACRSRSKSGH